MLEKLKRPKRKSVKVQRLRDVGKSLPVNLGNRRALSKGRFSIIGFFLERAKLPIPEECQKGLHVAKIEWELVKEWYGLTDKQLTSILLAGEMSDLDVDRVRQVRAKIELVAQSNYHKHTRGAENGQEA